MLPRARPFGGPLHRGRDKRAGEAGRGGEESAVHSVAVVLRGRKGSQAARDHAKHRLHRQSRRMEMYVSERHAVVQSEWRGGRQTHTQHTQTCVRACTRAYTYSHTNKHSHHQESESEWSTLPGSLTGSPLWQHGPKQSGGGDERFSSLPPCPLAFVPLSFSQGTSAQAQPDKHLCPKGVEGVSVKQGLHAQVVGWATVPGQHTVTVPLLRIGPPFRPPTECFGQRSTSRSLQTSILPSLSKCRCSTAMWGHLWDEGPAKTGCQLFQTRRVAATDESRQPAACSSPCF